MSALLAQLQRNLLVHVLGLADVLSNLRVGFHDADVRTELEISAEELDRLLARFEGAAQLVREAE